MWSVKCGGRGEAELQQIRSTLNQMRASGVGGPGVECEV